MKIYYSPYFNGHTYVDYAKHTSTNNGLMGAVIESTEGLLARLELMCGMAYPDDDDREQKRIKEYYQALKTSCQIGQDLYKSIQNDCDADERYNVTTELLRWRDNIILAGWDRKASLPGKLSVIKTAEPTVQANDVEMSAGSADRWLALLPKAAALKGKVDIEVNCPKILIPRLIQDVIGAISDDPYKFENLTAAEINNCTVIQFKEQYEAYQWLTQQPLSNEQVVVCQDEQRLDEIMNCFSKPITSKDAEVGCFHVISDARSILDIPQKLIWIDCNGDYGFHYPYDFMSKAERAALNVPDENDMIDAVHNHLIHVLNNISDVTLVSSQYDTSKLLVQHPMVTGALYKGGKKSKPTVGSIIPSNKVGGNVTHFEKQAHYNIQKKVDVGDPRMSYSALDTLIQYPFNHVVERELGLYEPFSDTDVRTEKGTVAHRVVQLMVDNTNPHKIDLNNYDKYFKDALHPKTANGTIIDSILCLDENNFECENLKSMLKNSLQTLANIISNYDDKGNSLEIVASEVEIPIGAQQDKSKSVNMSVFGKSVAYIDLLLRDKEDNFYIFDFKNSESSSYEEKLAENKSIQFAFYKEIFENFYNGGGKKVKGIGYYLFPLQTLFVPEDLKGDLNGNNIQTVKVDRSKINDTLLAMQNSFRYRKGQFHNGLIEEGEEIELAFGYTNQANLFPLETGGTKTNPTKKAPYSPSHIVLKNQIR